MFEYNQTLSVAVQTKIKNISGRDAPSHDAVFLLRRDDNGAPLGIIRYENEDAPTYAWVRTCVTKARRGATE
jgi:hypothetical protein